MSGKESLAGQPQNGQQSEKGHPQGSAGTSGGPRNWYLSDIQQMMYGFGDVPKPQHDSTVLIEDIVRQQLTSLLLQASDVASTRNGRFIGIEDLLFLLRKDKVKLRRLLRYMDVKDQRSMALKGVSDEGEEEQGGDKVAQPFKKRQKICYDFLSSIDSTGELVALMEDDGTDEVKRERLLRAELQTRYMDQKQYMEFCEARQMSFGRKYKSQRFKDWLLTGINTELKPNQQALEIFSYFAYETVAQIVDMALLVKQDKKALYGDPVTKDSPNVCINYYNQRSLGSGIGSPPSSTQGPASPVQSPPATPTTPGSTLSLSSSSSSLSASLPKQKSKKRKKCGIGSALEISSAIQPDDIHEAMRRYSQCIGPFSSHINTNPMVLPHSRLLCL
ncbi:transcription initiation protein SPT3 homolog isoform X2 [Ostrea edulis]|nr:transcription initiation protein SPT3 homolog isoform X2 [Ostrea edulis]XP_056016533.1 transcription initiation protein SPT3 homolog isoform X2 [Ostrea edulis]XP_056016534.1 transcription initiation protein SPT3 homolog isoform X2 [Ostrea edulis]XP_056016535.1 transcription initiation protein SPT3 homolog isoform X2 [Ostrea edulis]XP_056016536.1 transcription initiation protein SPT3 homolog isoform X2 [Ostrea edulis]XP_056016537.1 transcription initiation protein SPT3 homolog isoform X2 [Os